MSGARRATLGLAADGTQLAADADQCARRSVGTPRLRSAAVSGARRATLGLAADGALLAADADLCARRSVGTPRLRSAAVSGARRATLGLAADAALLAADADQRATKRRDTPSTRRSEAGDLRNTARRRLRRPALRPTRHPSGLRSAVVSGARRRTLRTPLASDSGQLAVDTDHRSRGGGGPRRLQSARVEHRADRGQPVRRDAGARRAAFGTRLSADSREVAVDAKSRQLRRAPSPAVDASKIASPSEGLTR